MSDPNQNQETSNRQRKAPARMPQAGDAVGSIPLELALWESDDDDDDYDMAAFDNDSFYDSDWLLDDDD